MWADLIADDLRPEFASPSSYAQKQATIPNIVRRSAASSCCATSSASDMSGSSSAASVSVRA